ncbi:hypothetical protein A9Q87_02185 [Flavobacteriales bacterium 34_180_T64]|nr:hypothetical protein A9Q87_02185 [Flavobacteriales bacterium 34_180_T64]
MKTLKVIASLLIVVNLNSCSDEPSNENIDEIPEVVGYTYQTYNLSTDPISVTNSREFTIENNKLQSYTNVNSQTSQVLSGSYNYSNDKISEILQYTDENLSSRKQFLYNSSGSLAEYNQETIDGSQLSSYIRIAFLHTNDTIYGTALASTDGINFDFNLATAKFVLDSNKNRTYSEIYSYSNFETNIITNTYDANNNMVIENRFSKLEDGSFFNERSYTYTYENSLNTLAQIYDATFGRELLMLLNQHLEHGGNATNYYNSKYISPNCFESHSSTLYGDIVSVEFDSILNENNFSVFNDYRTLANGELFSKFTYDFTFE